MLAFIDRPTSRKAWEQRQGESEHRIRQDLSAVLAALEVVVEEEEVEETEEEGEGVEDENEEENEEEEKDEEELLNSKKIAPTKNEELYRAHEEIMIQVRTYHRSFVLCSNSIFFSRGTIFFIPRRQRQAQVYTSSNKVN